MLERLQRSNFQNFFTKCFKERTLPNCCVNAAVVLIHTERIPNKPQNHRSVILLWVLYKLSSKVFTNRISHKVDSHYLREQARFWSTLSALDHIKDANQVMEETKWESQCHLVTTKRPLLHWNFCGVSFDSTAGNRETYCIEFRKTYVKRVQWPWSFITTPK